MRRIGKEDRTEQRKKDKAKKPPPQKTKKNETVERRGKSRV